MFVRFFARVDESDLGRTAAAYCDALVATGLPVRLVPTRAAELQPDARGRAYSIWSKHRMLLVTPMDDAFVNVVCGTPHDWQSFHTTGAKNILLLVEPNFTPEMPQTVLEGAVALYGKVLVPTAELATAVERATAYRPVVAPFDGDPITLRSHMRT